MKTYLQFTLSVMLFLGAVAVVTAPVVRSMLPQAAEVTTFRTSNAVKPYNPKETISVDFPNTNADEICKSLADMFELAIHVPTELVGKQVTVKLDNVSVVKVLEAMFPEKGIEVRYEGGDIYVGRRSNHREYPGAVAALLWTEKIIGLSGLVAAVVFFGSLFWRRNIQCVTFDLWKSLGLVFVLAGFWSILNWNEVTEAQSLLEISKPLNAWFILTGIGLWLRLRWARYLSLVVAWGGAVVIVLSIFFDKDVVWFAQVIGKLLPVGVILALLHSIRPGGTTIQSGN